MRQTFIDKILNIENKQLMKKWSDRNKSSGYHSVLLKKNNYCFRIYFRR